MADEPLSAPPAGIPLRAVVAALVTVTLWASAFVGIRSAGRWLSPGALAFGRLSIATIALGAILLVRREPLPPRRVVPGVLVMGIAWFGLYNLSLNEAERHLDAGTSAMLVNIGPILIAVLAGLVLREGFPRRLFAGCAVAFAGVVVIGVATAHHRAPLWAAALCVAAALCYAVGVVAQKPMLRHASALQLTFAGCFVGMVVCSPFAPQLVEQAQRAPASSLGWMAYLAIVPMAVGFVTWAYALSHTTAGKMGMTTYLVPPLAVLLGWGLLGQTPPSLAYAGGVLCLVGVGVAQGLVVLRRRPRPVPATA